MPELATNEEWRGIMARARKAHGLTQDQVGDKVGLSQVMISKIESGESASSTYILRICRVLSIPEPQHFANAESQHWSELGHLLRTHPEKYDAALKVIEVIAKQIEDAQAKPAANEAQPDRRK